MLENFREPYTQGNDAGKLVIRLSTGILLLLHGMAKLQTPEIIDLMASALADLQLPPQTAWLSLLGEVVAPILLIIGAFTRVAGVIITLQMAAVMMFAHTTGVSWFLPSGGYTLELQAMYMFSGITITCLGSGVYALIRD